MTAPQGARKRSLHKCALVPFGPRGPRCFSGAAEKHLSAPCPVPGQGNRPSLPCRPSPFWCLPLSRARAKSALTGCLRQPCAAGVPPAPPIRHPLTLHKWKPGQGWRGWLARPAAQRGHGPPPESTAALDAVGTPQPQPGSRRRAQPAPCSRGQSGKIGRGGPARRGLVKPEGREVGGMDARGAGRPLGAPRRRFQGWGKG